MIQRVLPSRTFLIVNRQTSQIFGRKYDAISSSRTLTPSLTRATRYYSSIPKDEEETEKQRVSLLSESQKSIELKQLDKEIARLNTLRGINNGELYTFRGRFKALARDYGMAFMAWYWVVWTSTAALTYTAIEVGNVDAIALLTRVDDLTGYDISSKVDPQIGTIGLTIAINELLEPLRLPIVVFTTKPIVDRISSS